MGLISVLLLRKTFFLHGLKISDRNSSGLSLGVDFFFLSLNLLFLSLCSNRKKIIDYSLILNVRFMDFWIKPLLVISDKQEIPSSHPSNRSKRLELYQGENEKPWLGHLRVQ
jgi:hypothetical protein